MADSTAPSVYAPPPLSTVPAPSKYTGRKKKKGTANLDELNDFMNEELAKSKESDISQSNSNTPPPPPPPKTT
ncbi:hypothetical protein QCA50_012753 [Cerrena zonata]|uniref:Uncharacterized protein n=2 Tax=Dikarya TaxID=451864 RepID=A0AAW0FZ31_9APHY